MWNSMYCIQSFFINISKTDKTAKILYSEFFPLSDFENFILMDNGYISKYTENYANDNNCST